jgi:hypothetical protein
MLEFAAEAATGLTIGLIATTFSYGLRHGFDWDHLAAIADITSSQTNARRSLLFATLYALGHGLVVLVLGLVAVFFGDFLPPSADRVMGKVVGVTLVLLGIYVFYALIRHGKDFRLRSRWMLVFSGVRRGILWIRSLRAGPNEVVEIEHEHEHGTEEPHHVEPVAHHAGREAVAVKTDTHTHRHRHAGVMPEDPFVEYGRATSFGVGMIHGVGAETPTQVLLFIAAAGAHGRGTGSLLLVTFLLGLFVSNSIVAVAASFGYFNAGGSWRVYATVAIITAIFSLAVGVLLLLSRDEILPVLFGT